VGAFLKSRLPGFDAGDVVAGSLQGVFAKGEEGFDFRFDGRQLFVG
jgi:hypothetical protein